jgi:hypothetical protein
MHIYINDKEILEREIKEDSGGVYYDEGVFVWWVNINNNFDAGEEETFDDAFSKLKSKR